MPRIPACCHCRDAAKALRLAHDRSLVYRRRLRDLAAQIAVLSGNGPAAPVAVHPIIAACAEAAGVTVDELLSPSRKLPVASARRAAILALFDAGMSASAIGRALSRDHTTVLFHLARARALAVAGA